jgi:hypothetical protein
MIFKLIFGALKFKKTYNLCNALFKGFEHPPILELS